MNLDDGRHKSHRRHRSKSKDSKRMKYEISRGDKSEEPYKSEHGEKDNKYQSLDNPAITPKEDLQREKENQDVQPVSEKGDDITTKTGGAYIPPVKLQMMRGNIADKTSPAYQRLAWEALKKSIHGLINKINVSNIGIIVKELFKENLIRGKGLFCRSLLQAQTASPEFTNVYAALIAVINSKFPHVGELLARRCIIQFKRAFRRNDKATCITTSTFIAHLVNQRMLHEIVALELLTLLVHEPTNDSIEVAISFLRECGRLIEVSSKGLDAIFDLLRNILHSGDLDKRIQYMIEAVLQIRKDEFNNHPAVIEELDLIEEEDQYIHLLSFDDDSYDSEDTLNVFKFDPDYESLEAKYKTLCKEILGNDEDDSGSDTDAEESGDDDENKNGTTNIIDNTETNLVAFRRTVYLTINSSLDYEECAHKLLLKMQLKPGQEMELCHMFLDCCAEQRTYEKFFALLAERFCRINRMYMNCYNQIFIDSYNTIHRLDTHRLRNVAKFFAHLFSCDAIPWDGLSVIKLNEEDTTSSGRVFIKILFQELSEIMSLGTLKSRILDPALEEAFSNLFPKDDPKNARFSINFFTLIGLGGLTDELRDFLKKPKPFEDTKRKFNESSSSSSSSTP